MSRYIPDLRSTYPSTKQYAPRGLREKQLGLTQKTEVSEILKKLTPAKYIRPDIARRAEAKKQKVAKSVQVNILKMASKELALLKSKIKNLEAQPLKAKFDSAPKYTKGMKSEFYSTREWRELRWKVVSNSNGCCKVCGRNNKDHGVVIHVDHIKPRSKFPELELELSNMQILCADCNLGKGALIQDF